MVMMLVATKMHDDDEKNDGDGKSHFFSQLGNT